MTGIVKGNDVIFLVNNGEDYVPFVCAKDLSIEILSNLVPVTTIGDGEWDRFGYQSFGYSVNLSGVVRFSAADFTVFDMVEQQMNALQIQAKIIFVDQEDNNRKLFKGYLLIERSTVTGNANAFALADFTLRGSGKPLIVGCDASIGGLSVEIIDESTIAVHLEDVEGAPAMFIYQLDTGFEEESALTDFNIMNIPGGPHTLTVIPVCVSGNRGEAIVYDFATEVIVDNPSCGVPTGISINAQTTTSFHVNWTYGALNTSVNLIIKNLNTGAIQEINNVVGGGHVVSGQTPGSNYEVSVIGNCGGLGLSAPYVITASTLVDGALPTLLVNNYSETVTVNKITINGIVIANFAIAPHTSYSFNVAAGVGPVVIEFNHSSADDSSITVTTQNQRSCQPAPYNGDYINTYNGISIGSTGITISINPTLCTS